MSRRSGGCWCARSTLQSDAAEAPARAADHNRRKGRKKKYHRYRALDFSITRRTSVGGQSRNERSPPMAIVSIVARTMSYIILK
ncbi:hypothetical protein PGIGA_G00020210 [Pangasianodon gigas]|uniref:Uncharacterized protein n=1 Tax=Pangasianodon gigas TaxID=30993 RepID=A0ACC5WV89_PANGG|nr:hypothetical protein [Pangasianodon gigas]